MGYIICIAMWIGVMGAMFEHKAWLPLLVTFFVPVSFVVWAMFFSGADVASNKTSINSKPEDKPLTKKHVIPEDVDCTESTIYTDADNTIAATTANIDINTLVKYDTRQKLYYVIDGSGKKFTSVYRKSVENYIKEKLNILFEEQVETSNDVSCSLVADRYMEGYYVDDFDNDNSQYLSNESSVNQYLPPRNVIFSWPAIKLYFLVERM